MYKKISSILLTLVLSLALMVPVFAAPTNGTISDPAVGAEVPVKLTAAAATFSVTVPTSLPINVDAAGVVTTATDAKIVNNSNAPVKVTAVQVNGVNSWELKAFDTAWNTVKVNSKQIGFNIFAKNVPVGGVADVTTVAAMDGVNAGATDELAVPYTAALATQSNALPATTNPLNVVFTIGWVPAT